MIRAKNEKDLLNILRLISSEAVGLSKKRMNENADPTVKSRYMKQYSKDEARYGRLSEEESEEEELPPEDLPAEEPAAEEPEEPVEEPAEEPAEETGEVGASFDSVVQAVNNLRAGKSLRDSSIKQQAQNYYDKLSDAERTTLLVFLKALSDIIAGQVDGKDAQDPSDPPVSINMSTGDEEDSSSLPVDILIETGGSLGSCASLPSTCPAIMSDSAFKKTRRVVLSASESLS